MIDFKLPSSMGNDFELSTCTTPVVIFFYPKDDTPGCTIENQDFTKLYPEFQKINIKVVGISRDTVASHCKFADKFNLSVELLSDVDEVVCKIFDVIKDKNMYGRVVQGIERSTFVLDTTKKIVKEWRKVKAENHAHEVLEFVRNYFA